LAQSAFHLFRFCTISTISPAFFRSPFSLQHPRWEFVFQPKYAAYLNLIEPWWKTLRSLALKGRRFETWAEVEQAIEAATAY
jgi:hypothetical protein